MSIAGLKQLINSYAYNDENKKVYEAQINEELNRLAEKQDQAREIILRADVLRANLDAVCNLDRGDGECQHYQHCETSHAYDKARRTLKSPLQYTYQRDRAALLDLLAIIHRDGGHHTEDVGVEQSVEDAHQIWCDLQTLRLALEEPADSK